MVLHAIEEGRAQHAVLGLVALRPAPLARGGRDAPRLDELPIQPQQGDARAVIQ